MEQIFKHLSNEMELAFNDNFIINPRFHFVNETKYVGYIYKVTQENHLYLS